MVQIHRNKTIKTHCILVLRHLHVSGRTGEDYVVVKNLEIVRGTLDTIVPFWKRINLPDNSLILAVSDYI